MILSVLAAHIEPLSLHERDHLMVQNFAEQILWKIRVPHTLDHALIPKVDDLSRVLLTVSMPEWIIRLDPC